jgi:hypothetical protein
LDEEGPGLLDLGDGLVRRVGHLDLLDPLGLGDGRDHLVRKDVLDLEEDLGRPDLKVVLDLAEDLGRLGLLDPSDRLDLLA